jgi:hypothetical protein
VKVLELKYWLMSENTIYICGKTYTYNVLENEVLKITIDINYKYKPMGTNTIDIYGKTYMFGIFLKMMVLKPPLLLSLSTYQWVHIPLISMEKLRIWNIFVMNVVKQPYTLNLSTG